MAKEIKDNYMAFTGVVEKVVNDKVFVIIDNNRRIICSISGKLRQNGIMLAPDDKVNIEVSAYDPSMGRVVFRIR